VTRTHHRCGHLNPADDRYARSRFVVCDGCGATFDQDGSATLNMLAASGHIPPASQGTARDTA
jgi:transposase